MASKIIRLIGFVLITANVYAGSDTTSLRKNNVTCSNFYFDTGELNSTGCYTKQNDSIYRQGLWVFYFKNGKVSDSVIFRNNEITGRKVSFYENGEINQIAEYSEDAYREKYFYEKGNSYQGNYIWRDSVYIPSGWYVYSDSKQALTDSVLYVNGEQTESKHFYKSGQVFVHTTYSADKKSRDRCVFKKNGKIRDCDHEIWSTTPKGVEGWVDTNPEPMSIWLIILPIAVSSLVVSLL